MSKQHRVELTDAERADLTALLRRDDPSGFTLRRARIVLQADVGGGHRSPARHPGARRLRIRPPRQFPLLPDLRPALGLAAGDRPRATHRARLRPCRAAAGRRGLPGAARIVLVLDNLNTHTAGALYAAFPPATARRLWDTLEVHYTPKHGSWLNIAELELAVLARQCLPQRMPDRATLEVETTAWVDARNAAQTPTTWRFSIDDARTHLAHLYPIPTAGQ